MFCLAADFVTCDPKGEDDRCRKVWVNPGNTFQSLKLQDPLTFQAKVSQQDQQVDVTSIKGITTANNQASLACMIIWPDANKARVTHYFAGDAGAKEFQKWTGDSKKGGDIEERILRWSTVPTGKKGVRNPIPIDGMKLSHHGKLFCR